LSLPVENRDFPFRAPIEVQENALRHSIRIGDAVDFEIEDVVPFGVETGEPARLTGIFHPAGSELTFALGVMSLAWMAFVAALIALEKTVPWHRAVTWGTAAVLLALAIALLATPDPIPGLVVPSGAHGVEHTMDAMP
jgi:hypothetical protein